MGLLEKLLHVREAMRQDFLDCASEALAVGTPETSGTVCAVYFPHPAAPFPTAWGVWTQCPESAMLTKEVMKWVSLKQKMYSQVVRWQLLSK